MIIPFEGSDYESDTDYVASVSSSFSDVTGAELVSTSYDLIENHLSVSMPSSRRTSLIPEKDTSRRGSLIPEFLLSPESMPIDQSLRVHCRSESPERVGKVTSAHVNVGACYMYKRKTLFLDLKFLDVLENEFGQHDQLYILVQIWRLDDTLHVYTKLDDNSFRKKLCEFEFKSKFYSITSSTIRGSKIDLESCCFECVLTSYFIYTVTFKLMLLDKYSRHNPLGEAHLVLRDLLPDKEFDRWLAIELDKESYTKELLISLCFLPTSERITLTVIKARNLRYEQSGMTPTNASVRVTYIANGKKQKRRRTSTKLDDEHPVFNESFHFSVAEHQMRSALFKITVENNDMSEEAVEPPMSTRTSLAKMAFGCVSIGAKCNPGVATHHWNEMLKVHRRPVAQWHVLK
ncbi:synaptotagmin 1-like isoform X2 [Convolutriloba macropyga]